MSDVAAEARTQMVALGAGGGRPTTRASWLAPSSCSRRAATPTPRPRSKRCRRAAATIASWWPCASPSATTISGDHRQAVAGLQPYLSGAKREAEARFFHLSSTARAGRSSPPTWRRPRALVSDFEDGRVDGRDAEQPGHALHRHRRRRDRRRPSSPIIWSGSRRASTAPARRGGSAGGNIAPADFEGAAAIFDQRGGRLPALRLPSELDLLGGPRLRQGQPAPRAKPASSWCASTISHSYYGRLAGRIPSAPGERVALAGRRAARAGGRRRRRPACRRTRSEIGS